MTLSQRSSAGILIFFRLSSFVLDNSLFCGSVAIFARPNGSFRLVYPNRSVVGRKIDVYHPISVSFGKQIENEVVTKYEEVVNHGWNRHDNSNLSTR